MVTLKDIAKETGLNFRSVSQALHGHGRYSAETRQRVQQAAERLGYRPNAIARSMAKGRTYSIGIIVPTFTGDSYEHMLHGIESAMGDAYTLLLGVSEYDGMKERKLLHSFRQRMVDGLIVVHAGCEENLDVMKELLHHGVPIVQADRFYGELQTDVVGPDDEALGFMLTEHFIQLGHRNIFFLRSSIVNSSTLGRAAGYERAMREHRLTPELFPDQPVAAGQDRIKFSYALAKQLLDESEMPLAVVTHDISIAFGVLEAAREMGLQDSKDLAIGTVANASDNPLYKFLPSNVTLAVWSVRDMGYHAGNLLLRRLDQPEKPAAQFQTVRIPCQLVTKAFNSTLQPLGG